MKTSTGVSAIHYFGRNVANISYESINDGIDIGIVQKIDKTSKIGVTFNREGANPQAAMMGGPAGPTTKTIFVKFALANLLGVPEEFWKFQHERNN